MKAPEQIAEAAVEKIAETVPLDADARTFWAAQIQEAIDAYRVQAGIEVQLWNAEHDGVRVVQIDTPGEGRLRINLNDAPIWDGDPATDERPGAHFHDVWDDNEGEKER
jgi:hypothetical protein